MGDESESVRGGLPHDAAAKMPRLIDSEEQVEKALADGDSLAGAGPDHVTAAPGSDIIGGWTALPAGPSRARTRRAIARAVCSGRPRRAGRRAG